MLFVDIEKRLGNFNLKVKLEAGEETLALLGPSGCGKSVTLKCIAGIIKPDRGRIAVDDITLFDSEKHINLKPQQRHTGLLFQSYALFPHMTVLQNIKSGIKGRCCNGQECTEQIYRIIDSFGLNDVAHLFPSQLSGGQQQRTALARIIMSQPKMLMLDEPFSALDSHLRFNMEQEVREIIKQFGKTVLLVSHDRDVVFRMADSVTVMNNGGVETAGSKKRVFAEPQTVQAAILTGCKNISRVEYLDERHIYAKDWGIELETDINAEGFSYVGVRMHEIDCDNGCKGFPVRVDGIIENPFSFTIMLKPTMSESMVALAWETDKDRWRSINKQNLTMRISAKKLLLLREG